MSTSSSIVTSSFSVKEIAEDRDMINDCSVELHQPARNVFTAVINNQLPSSSCMVVPHQVEIIDVPTPSPDCRTSLYEKKRRISTVRPEIIDLTKSPILSNYRKLDISLRKNDTCLCMIIHCSLYTVFTME
ncbi:hypothetical protein CFP56_009200 [Quercus suber]